MTSYTITHQGHRSRFPGDKLAHDVYHVLRDGQHVATIHDHGYGQGKWSVNLGPVRGMGLGLPEWPSSLAWKCFDAGPFGTIQEAFGIAQERAEFIIQYREGSQCCPC